jgi:hypothetical protein
LNFLLIIRSTTRLLETCLIDAALVTAQPATGLLLHHALNGSMLLASCPLPSRPFLRGQSNFKLVEPLLKSLQIAPSLLMMTMALAILNLRNSSDILENPEYVYHLSIPSSVVLPWFG